MPPIPRKTAAGCVVTAIFPQALALLDYLLGRLGGDAVNYLLQESDESDFQELLQSVKVVDDALSPLFSHNKVVSPSQQVMLQQRQYNRKEVQEIINRAIPSMLTLSQSKSLTTQNCLAFGYRQKSVSSQITMRNNLNIEHYHINSLHQLLSTIPWQKLVSRIGEEEFRNLLAKKVFVRSKQGSYMQVCGSMITNQSYAASVATAAGAVPPPPPPPLASNPDQGMPNPVLNIPLSAPSTAVAAPTQCVTLTLTRHYQLYNTRPMVAVGGLPRGHPLYTLGSKGVVKGHVLKKYCDGGVAVGDGGLAAGGGDVRDELSQLPHLDALTTILTCVFDGIINRQRIYSYTDALQKFCSSSYQSMSLLPSHAHTPALPSNRTASRKRGCRAGAHAQVKKKQRDNKLASLLGTSNVSDAGKGDGTGVHYGNADMEIVTMGDKIAADILRHVGKDTSSSYVRTNTHADLCSQQFESPALQTSPLVPANHASTQESAGLSMSSTSQSKAARKRIKRRLHKLLHSRNQGGTFDDKQEKQHVPSNLGAVSSSGLHQHLNRSFLTHETVNLDKRIKKNNSNVNQCAVKGIDAASKTQSTDSKSNHAVPKVDAQTAEVWEKACHTSHVVQFIQSICLFLFDESVWGSKHNIKVFMRSISVYLHQSRQESLSAEQLIHGIRTQDMPWLREYQQQVLNSTGHEQGFGANAEYCGQGSDYQTRMAAFNHHATHILQSLVFFIFQDVINSFVANFFYVTEVEGKGLEMFYFQKKAWNKIIREHIQDFKHQFVPVYMPVPLKSASNGASLAGSSPSKLSRTSTLPSLHTDHIPPPPSSTGNSSLARSASEPARRPPNSSLYPTSHIPPNYPASKQALPSQPPYKPPTQQTIGSAHLPSIHSSHMIPGSTSVPKPPQSRLFNSMLHLQSSGGPSSPGRVHSTAQALLPTSSSVNAQVHSPTRATTSSPTAPYQSHTATTITNNHLNSKYSVDARKLHTVKKYYNIPTVRFVPKKHTVRPIANLSNKPLRSAYTHNKLGLSGGTHDMVVSNSMLYNSYFVLKAIYDIHPALGGAAVFSADDIYRQLSSFKRGIVKGNNVGGERKGGEKKLYVAVLDVEKCFDHINCATVFDIVEKILRSYTGQDDIDCHMHPSDLYSQSTSSQQQDAISEASNEKIVIHKYNVTQPQYDKRAVSGLVNKPVRYVSLQGSLANFGTMAPTLASLYPKSVVADYVVYGQIGFEELVDLLGRHLFGHVVKMPAPYKPPANKVRKAAEGGSIEGSNVAVVSDHSSYYYNQIQGIPQGSVLSALLCTFYYGFIEHKVFGKFLPDGDTMNDESSSTDNGSGPGIGESKVPDSLGIISGKSRLLRCIDDYLVVSTDPNYVLTFLSSVFTTFAMDYNVHVNMSKVKANFDITLACHPASSQVVEAYHSSSVPEFAVQKHCIKPIDVIPWCGWLLDCSDQHNILQVRPDFARVMKQASSTSSIPNMRSLLKSTCNYIRAKSHMLILDGDVLNSLSTIFQNIVAIFTVAAYRMSISVDKLRRQSKTTGEDCGHLLQCIRRSILYGARLIQARSKRSGNRDSGSKTQQLYRRVRGMASGKAESSSSKQKKSKLDHHFYFAPMNKVMYLGWLAFHRTATAHCTKSSCLRQKRLLTWMVKSELEAMQACTWTAEELAAIQATNIPAAWM